MKKLFTITLAAATLLSACTYNKKELAKVHNMALVSAGTQKLFYHGAQSISGQLIAANTGGDTLSFNSFADQLKGKCFSEVFVSLPIRLIAEDSIIKDSSYQNLQALGNKIGVLDRTPAKGYKMLEDNDVANVQKMAKIYPNSDAFMFVRANYKVEKVASLSAGSGGLLSSVDVAGLARVTASYYVSIYNKQGKKIMFYRTVTHWSKSVFPFALSLGFNEKSREALIEADSYAYREFKKDMQRKLKNLNKVEGK